MDLLNEVSQVPPLAPKRTRVFAALIDFVILLLGSYLIAALSGQAYYENGTIGFTLTDGPALIALLFAFALLPVNEGLTGQTIGKRICKIKVVKTDYTKVNLLSSIVRHLFDCIDCLLLIGLMIASTNKNKQRIGDLVAGTYVVVKT